MREQTLEAVEHLGVPSGAAVLVDREVMDGLLEKLHKGVPTMGWAGDPRLCLAFNRPDQRWELWRLEHDYQYRLICRSKPGMGLDNRLISSLVAHDSRRGYNVGADIIQSNTRLQDGLDQQTHERMVDIMTRVYWNAGKDVGHLY